MPPSSAPHVLVIETPGLGNRGYVVHDGQVAIAIDPQRDIDRVQHLLAEHGLVLSHVLETHVHNDYVSGGLELARAYNAVYVAPADAQLRYDHLPVGEGDTFGSGELSVVVLATPGHTPHHVSYVVRRSDAAESRGSVVFTGGSMLYGAVGRPDLVTPELTEPLAHHQWHSVRRLADDLDADTRVFPTHGFGSFCAATQNDGVAGTIADEQHTNPALVNEEQPFVEETLAGLDVFPAYYAHMGPANADADGPPAVDLSLPRPAGPEDVRERISRGEWVIDLRSREVYSRGHLRGTLSFDLDGSFIAYVGWLIPWGTPLTLLGENTEQVEAAQRELVRIGIDRPVAQAVGGPEYWSTDEAEPSSVERVTFEGLAARHAADPDIYVLDVRQQLEWDEGHTAGAHHIPFYRVMDRLHEIPRDRPVYVACGSGYRAAAVVSLLRQQAAVHRWDGTIDGFDNLVHVDDDWANASRTSLPIEAASSQEREPGWTWSESRATARSAATWLAA